MYKGMYGCHIMISLYYQSSIIIIIIIWGYGFRFFNVAYCRATAGGRLIFHSIVSPSLIDLFTHTSIHWQSLLNSGGGVRYDIRVYMITRARHTVSYPSIHPEHVFSNSNSRELLLFAAGVPSGVELRGALRSRPGDMLRLQSDPVLHKA